MSEIDIYTADDPTMLYCYKDQTGKLHETRDQAVFANFNDDLALAMAYVIEGDSDLTHVPILQAMRLFRKMAAKHPDMLRVLIGDKTL